MVAIKNGEIPDEMLFPIEIGRPLLLGAKLSWDRLARRVQSDFSWTLQPGIGITAYRSFANQERIIYQNYTRTNTGHGPAKFYAGKWWWRRTAGTPSAATPGTSNHGYGNAVDVAGMGTLNNFSDPQYKQLTSIAGPYGWDNNEGRSIGEPWHWVYKSQNDTHDTNDGNGEVDMPITQADADLIVGTLLNYANPASRPSVYSYLISAGSQAHSAADSATAVWNTPVKRGGENVAILQDSANGTTAATAAAASSAASLKILQAGGTTDGGGTPLDVAALVTLIADEVERRIESAKIVIPD